MTLTVDALLRAQARAIPDTAFLRFASGDMSYREVNDAAGAAAASLALLGLSPGEPIAMLLPNCPEFVILWFAANNLGAVAAPINTAMRGPALAHMLNLSRARILVLDAAYAEAIGAIRDDLHFIAHVIVRGDAAIGQAVLPHAKASSLAALHSDNVQRPHPTAGGDPSIMLSTSGTTGRSKACVLSHRYVVRQAELLVDNFALTDNDILYCPFPLFHLDAAVLTVMPAMVLGATAAIGERFSVSGFWEEVRRFGATVFDFMGATLTLLHKAPRHANDAANDVRLAWGVPIPEFAEEFEARFGLRLVELYGSTDAGVPVYQPLNEPRRHGSCGRPIPAYELRLLDREDNEVPVGSVGEIALRPREPHLIASGYYGMPAATVESRRNLWFHTGDLARLDDDNYLYFVGRLTDTIRRRGENISAFEVEEVIKSHPDVLDAAAYGVPSELTEEEVMISVVARPGHVIDQRSLVNYCEENMARYMVPRYIEVLDHLPRTPTEKVEKHVLAERGITPSTWDKESSARQ